MKQKKKGEQDVERRKERFAEHAEAIKKQVSEASAVKNVKNNTYSFRRLLHAAFNLSADQAGYDEIDSRIESGVVLRGTNMCILILAIFIASVGLNMNSTAVIIGAMLVSPLMGPIMGIGFSLAVYDMNLLKKSATVLLFEVIVALSASTLYFWLTPITTASSELLARTSPNTWDVIIAICGGLAGMIGTTREEKSNIIPGVAIATALMPPLCTAGYGLAMGNLRYFAGAMYLFCINGIFIAISTMLIAVFLGLPAKHNADEKKKKNVLKRVAIVAVAAIVPSLFLAAGIVSDTSFTNNVDKFVNQEFQFENTQVVKYSVSKEKDTLDVAVIGTTLSEDTIAALERNMGRYHIERLKLKVHQTEVKAGITQDELEAYIKNETNVLNAESEEEYKELQAQLIAAKTELAEYQGMENDADDLSGELKILYPKVESVSAGYVRSEGAQIPIAVLTVSGTLSPEEMKTCREWLKKRIHKEEILLYQEAEGILYPADIRVPEPEKLAGKPKGSGKEEQEETK